ncbi:MAG: response regulator [Candidatus Eisenbacteria bacterium]|nr:response regulator [Candidatus Eisenbacteria bacterium]
MASSNELSGSAKQWRKLFVFIFISICVLLCSNNPSMGIQTNFVQISLNEGLSQSIVKCIIQDQRGFMWFGTEDGLNRYDGYDFRIFKHNPDDANSPSYSDILTIMEDSRGLLWIGTFHGGLNCYDPATNTFTRFQSTDGSSGFLSNEIVHSLTEDRSGAIWIGTDLGLNRYDPAAGTFKQFLSDSENPKSISGNTINALFTDRSGTVWIGTDNGLDILHTPDVTETRGSFDAVPAYSFKRVGNTSETSKFPQNITVQALIEDDDGVLWVGTGESGLIKFDKYNNQVTSYTFDPSDPNSINSDNIQAICLDASGILWIGTNNGLNRLDRHTGHLTRYNRLQNSPGSLSRDDVRALYADRSGVLWIGTYGGGVDKLDLESKAFVHYKPNTITGGMLSHSIIWSVIEDHQGILWIGTHGNGLDRLDRTTNSLENFQPDPSDPNSLSNAFVRCIYEDRAHVLWIGTNGGGLNRFDSESKLFTSFRHDPDDPKTISADQIRTIYEDRGGVLWIGTYGGGLDSFDRQSSTFSNYKNDTTNPHSISNNYIRSIYEDEDEAGHVLWIGTEGGGICRLDRETGMFTRYLNDPDNPNSLSENHVFSIVEDSSGILWIATYAGGLNRYDRQTGAFTSYTIQDGLASNAIYGILQDDHGILWLSTNMGLSKFDPRTETFRNFDTRDGLQSNEFNGGSFYRSARGEMFFGGINGFNAFFPDDIMDNPYLSHVIITDILIFNKSVTIGSEINASVILDRAITDTKDIVLSYREDVFTFEFSGLHFVTPERNQYAYMMEGFERDWNYVGSRRFATYTCLPPGDYVFLVKSSNSDNVWNENALSLNISITPPFWQTLWFRSIVILIALFFIIAFYRFRTYGIRKQNRALQQEIKERERAEVAMQHAMAIANDANQVKSEFLANISHEFRTPMNGIIGMTMLTLDSDLDEDQRENLEIVKHSADSLLEIMNNILEISNIIGGDHPLGQHDFKLTDLLDEIDFIKGTRIRDKGIEFRIIIDSDVPINLKGNRNALHQVLKEVVGNAEKFTDKGSIELHIRRSKSIPPNQDTILIEFTICDTGIGISSENMDSIFDSFRQADGSHTREHGGTGIGLTICRQLLKMMKGSISVKSEVGQGSTFQFNACFGPGQSVKKENLSLEISEYSAYSPKKYQETQPQESNSLDILLVEDIVVNQMVASAMLKRAGHSTKIAENGAVALDKLASGEFDLILMDIQMPVMNGFEATSIIRHSDSWYRDIPIIAVTAHTLEEDQKRCLESGMNGYIAKPINNNDLKNVIASVMHAHACNVRKAA